VSRTRYAICWACGAARSSHSRTGLAYEHARGWPLSDLEEAAFGPMYHAFRVDMAAWFTETGRVTDRGQCRRLAVMSGQADAPEPTGQYLAAVRRAFQFAREMHHGCGPADFLVGIAGGDGPAATALGRGPTLRAAATAATVAAGRAREGAGYLHMQAQQAAMSLAQTLGQPPDAEHLLIALLDQGTPEVSQTLAEAGLDPAEVRRSTLAGIGVPPDHPPLPMPPLIPAGTLDRPPLEVGELDERAWRVLRWRQDHLPLHRVRGAGEAAALIHLERAAAGRLAERLQLDEDQASSLIRHHDDEVQARIARERPGLDRPRQQSPRRPGVAPVGWPVWFGNRRTGMRDRVFRLRTIRDYRDCPQPQRHRPSSSCCQVIATRSGSVTSTALKSLPRTAMPSETYTPSALSRKRSTEIAGPSLAVIRTIQ